MPDVNVSRIEPTNPVITSYVNTIKGWDKDGQIQVEKEGSIIPFYAIYLDSIFLGASSIELDKESSLAKVAMINNSFNYSDYIKTNATKQLEDIINNEYGTNKVEFSYYNVKKIG